MDDDAIDTALRVAALMRLCAVFERLQTVASTSERNAALLHLSRLRHAVAHRTARDNRSQAVERAQGMLARIDMGSLDTTESLLLRLLAEPEQVAEILARSDRVA